MNYCLALAIFLVSLMSFGQKDSLLITTSISVDSIYVFNQKLNFSQVNDTVLKMTVDRNSNSTDGMLVIYSGQKRYETSFTTDPIADFPGEWRARDKSSPITIRMVVKKGQLVVTMADGSAVNRGSGLFVYGPSGDLIPEESAGVVEVAKKSKGKSLKQK